MRLPWPAVVGGTLVALLGAAGLVRAAMPDGHAAPSGSSIAVTGVFMRAPVPPTTVAAAYFTVTNSGGSADRLESVSTDAGPTADLHVDEPDGTMVMLANGIEIPAHGRVVLTTGQTHVMIENVYPRVKPGTTAHFTLRFQDAGTVRVTAPVLAIGTPAPTASTSSRGGS